MRRLSCANRLLRVLTALVTVWCLGCSAFEPMLDQLAVDAAVPAMACGGAGAADRAAPSVVPPGSVMDQASPAGPTRGTLVRPADEPECGFDCGCHSCIAEVAPEYTFLSDHAASPTPGVHLPSAHRSMVREPLVPPPQRPLTA